jgi:serine beta-lactamase-like protein LACTB, mitochondrial
MSDQRIPGLSIAIATPDGTIWANGYGMSDMENFVPAKASTVYRTASIAKPITAVTALKLEEAGRLDPDAPIDRYIPSFPQKTWPITTRQLLGHLGGIRSYKDGHESYLTRHYRTLADSITIFSGDPLLHEPGTAYHYSTFGYVLAGFVVETVAQQPFTSYLEEHIFKPAGMNATSVDDLYAIIPNRSRGYQKRKDGVVLNAALADTSHKIPGGGLVSTAPDLVRFALSIGKSNLLKEASVEEMWRPMKTTDGRTTGYGLGWGISEFAGHRQVSHSGGQAGVSTLLRYLPEEDVALAIMCNLEGAKHADLADLILSIVLR